jgi:hypothetical protein
MDAKKEAMNEPTHISRSLAQSETEAAGVRVNGEPSGFRYASDDQFRKAHRKTSALHGGLFLRLSK